MNHGCRLLIVLLIVSMSAGGSWAQTPETVVISKSRLEELERKEAELERLKRELRKTSDETKEVHRNIAKDEKETSDLTGGQAAESRVEPVKASTESSAVTRTQPVITTLTPLAPGQVVAAVDVMSHYRTQPGAAAQRYEAGRIRVAGEIMGFDKPMFVRHAVVTLKTSEPSWRVVCRLEPPANLPNLFTAKNGDELVGSTSSGARSVLASVGQKVVIEGWCQGLKGQSVTLTSAKLISVE